MLIIKNATIVTQDPSRQIIKDGAVLVEGEKIAAIGPTKKMEKKYARAAEEIIDGKNKVIMPGLINAHTHTAMTLLRGYADDVSLKDWLTKKIWPAEAKFKPKNIYDGTLIACKEMIKSGTTTFNDMYWHLGRTIKAVNKMGLRAFVGLIALDVGKLNFNPEYIHSTYRQLLTQIDKKIKLSVAPHAIYTTSKETLIWCKKFADENNLLIHIHLSETEEEIKNCLKHNGCLPVEYLDKINFLDKNVLAAHCCWLSDNEIKILAKRKVSVAHCPTSNLKLVSGIMPLSKLLKARVNVCLGTDSPASNNSLDMFSEMKIAALIHKWNERNPEVADAKTILDLATINGAKALGMEKEIGSLEIGKKADIIMLNFKQPHLKPHLNTVSHLVYAARGSDVERVIIGGGVLL